MGQAKNRGTYEERKKQAIDKKSILNTEKIKGSLKAMEKRFDKRSAIIMAAALSMLESQRSKK